MFKSLILAAAAAFSLNVSAQAIESSIPEAQLLTGYWKCFAISDATEGQGYELFPESEMAACTIISKTVQVRYFNDDFGLLHTWTQANRARTPVSIGK